MENEFKMFLSAITGDAALTKLDVVDPVKEMKRLRLAREYGLDGDKFDAALFIYICNVLDEAGVANWKVGRKDLIARTAKIITQWFQETCVLGKDTVSMIEYVSRALGHCNYLVGGMTGYTHLMGKLEKDMTRVYSVWYELVLEY